MQLNKVLKGLMLALPVMAVAACSSNKSNDNADQMINSGDSNGSMSAEEQARMMMQ
ncbi:MAG: peptidoglycan-associated outer membrane lipoprotein, partial [Plesiomonas shigelloides]